MHSASVKFLFKECGSSFLDFSIRVGTSIL